MRRITGMLLMAVFWWSALSSLHDGSAVASADAKTAPGDVDAIDRPLRERAAEAMRRACQFYRDEVAVEGGYVWRYSEDLSRREGEGKVGPTTIWVQPPGTPTVGMAYLTAYRATGEPFYLDAARETAGALVAGQLQSGGWDYRVEFAPEARRRYAYRVEGDADGERRNLTTLDDDTTQAALRFLMLVDRALEFKDVAIHSAAIDGLQALLDAQYPNGAWPQRFAQPPDDAEFPVQPASYPESWSRKHPGARYHEHYTLNDNTIADTIRTMLEAAWVYGDSRYRAAAERGGDFIILAQMPEPQPAWAQQYDREMQPAWARKFEPPAVTGGESQGAMRTLMALFRVTGESKYLEPLPRAIAYFRRSALDDGRLARFYELKTNRPLYFTREYELTYDDGDLPTHYGFKSGNQIEKIAAEYERLRAGAGRLRAVEADTRAALTSELEERVKSVVAALDDRGRWVEAGRLRYHGADDPARRVIASATFVANVNLLCRYIEAATRTFQGRSTAEWSERLDDKSRLVRLGAIKALGALAAVKELIAAAESDDAAIRYWALVELRHAGPSAEVACSRFRASLGDESPIVRVAAAAGLCHFGDHDEVLSVLAELLSHPQETVRLAAVTTIDESDAAVRALRAQLEAALSDESKYVVRVATRALRRINNDVSSD